MTSQPLPRAAYIHVPFCARRCGYCNFALVANRSDLVEPYLRAIEIELALIGEPREVDTLYFGGGTPTQLAPAEFRQLADSVTKWHPLTAGYEWTVEANPADVTSPLMQTLANLGVTRLSIGGQSFNDRKLRVLERDHQTVDLCQAIRMTKRENLQVAVDLIFAAPRETLSDWEADLDALLDLQPEHISTYGLTFEKGTSFGTRLQKGEIATVDEDLEREMYELAINKLTSAGYEHYEISNFALPGCRSRHNQVYWSGREYFAAGPGAARYVAGVRETNHGSTTTYLKKILAGESAVTLSEKLTPEERAHEQLIFGLRQLEGVNRHKFQQQTGHSIDELVGTALKKFRDLGLLQDDGQQICLTHEGLMVSDAIWPELL